MNVYFQLTDRETEAKIFVPDCETHTGKKQNKTKVEKLLVFSLISATFPWKHMKDAFILMMKLPATTESSTKPSVSLIISQLISNHTKQIHLHRVPSNTVLAGKLDGRM